MSGSIDIDGQKVNIVVFKNKHKQEGERTPDYRIFKSEPKSEQASGERKREIAAEQVAKLTDTARRHNGGADCSW